MICEKIEVIPTFNHISETTDSFEILRKIKDIWFIFEIQKYKMKSLHETKKHFYSFIQDCNMSFQVYMENFNNLVDVVEHCVGTLGQDGSNIIDSLMDMNVTHTAANTQQIIESKGISKA